MSGDPSSLAVGFQIECQQVFLASPKCRTIQESRIQAKGTHSKENTVQLIGGRKDRARDGYTAPQTLEVSQSQFRGHLTRRVGNENARSKQGSILYIRGAIKNLKSSERFISAGNTWTAERAQQRRADTSAEGTEALASSLIRVL